MTRTLNADTKEVLSLESFVQHVASCDDLNTEEGLTKCALALRALANNKSFLTAFIRDGLGRSGGFQPENAFSPDNIQLGRGPGFVVRALTWLPDARTYMPTSETAQREAQMRMFGLAHSHDFQLLTVGYWGPGYLTRLFTYHPQPCDAPGSRVDLRRLPDARLSEGRVMHYRPYVDVHEQQTAPSFSISLNLIAFVDAEAKAQRDAYVFDSDAQTILRLNRGRSPDNDDFIRIASAIGDAQTTQLLDQIRLGRQDA